MYVTIFLNLSVGEKLGLNSTLPVWFRGSTRLINEKVAKLVCKFVN